MDLRDLERTLESMALDLEVTDIPKEEGRRAMDLNMKTSMTTTWTVWMDWAL